MSTAVWIVVAVFAVGIIASGLLRIRAWLQKPAPPEVIEAMSNAQSQATSAPNTPAQAAATRALTMPQDCVETMRKAFEERRDAIVRGINAIPGLSCVKPDGAFYVMMNVSALLGKRIDGQPIADCAAFACGAFHTDLLPGSDRVVLESTLRYKTVVNDVIRKTGVSNIKGTYLVWNMVDGREKSELYEVYEQVIAELGLHVLKTFIPDSKRFRRELSAGHRPLFRSTLFPADRSLLRGSNIEALTDEVLTLLNLRDNG